MSARPAPPCFFAFPIASPAPERRAGGFFGGASPFYFWGPEGKEKALCGKAQAAKNQPPRLYKTHKIKNFLYIDCAIL